MTAEYQRNDTVAIITLNNPPINGMGSITRAAIAECLKKALADHAIKAIVITGAGKAFSGGADIKEFNSPKVWEEPTLHTLIHMIEDAEKPVVAAIHSVCVGGGLELSLACHYRIAAPHAKIGLPEVKLGILPGAGGTQRLPRAVGVEMALNMIVSGMPMTSNQLVNTALLDALSGNEGEDFIVDAVAFAKRIADTRPLPKVRDINITLSDHAAFFQSARVRVGAMAGSFPAPLKCVDAVEAAVTMLFDEGIRYEHQLFLDLVETTESKALRHAFFGERMAGKIPDVPDGTPIRSIQSAAVIGAGTMGSGIAMNFANAGIPVMILDTQQDALDRGLATIRKHYESSARKGKLSKTEMEQRIARISSTLSFDDIAQVDMVIEAVFEDMAIKESVFRQLDRIMKPGAILASNTSTLDINRLAGVTGRAQDVIGTHFFSPANVMRLLEIVRGAQTSKEVLASTLALSKQLKKVGVVSGVCDGFIGNRMIEQYSRQAGFLLDEGCMPQQVDDAMEQFGFAMGPFRMADMAGNDIGWAIRKRRYAENPQFAYSKTADLLCELGRFGQKTGAGWYDYQSGDRTAHVSLLVNDMIARHARTMGIAPRKIDDQEIVERLVYALVNEGARILEEGIALRASDIDMIYLTGYGFPLHRGGPMFYADTVGLASVIKSIAHYAQGYYGAAWKPAPLLLALAKEEKTFN